MGVLPFEGGAEQGERGALSARKGHESSPRSQFDQRGEEARAEGTESFCPILPPYFALSGKRMCHCGAGGALELGREFYKEHSRHPVNPGHLLPHLPFGSV